MEPWVPLFFAGMYESIAAHSRLGLNVVVDVGHHDSFTTPMGILFDCARRLRGLPVLLVGVRCPAKIVLKRRRETWGNDWTEGDPIPPGILEWDREVHTPGIYDLEVDTSVLKPNECAETIRNYLESEPGPTAFQKLGTMACKRTTEVDR